MPRSEAFLPENPSWNKLMFLWVNYTKCIRITWPICYLLWHCYLSVITQNYTMQFFNELKKTSRSYLIKVEMEICVWVEWVIKLSSIIFIQVVLCQIFNICCHQLTQNTTTDFVRFTKIYTYCSKIQNTSFASFEFVSIS